MIHLQTLGAVAVATGSGHEPAPLLAQPKRLALFVYLALARPRGLHRRDHLLALFWPDSDEARARASLNQALTFLRRELDAEVVVTRGADSVGVDREHLACDVDRFEKAIGDRAPADALALYQGHFLEALHVDDAPGVVEWADRERDRLRALALQAAIDVANHERDHGNTTAALAAIRRAREFVPLDETAVRVQLLILGESGNRAAAAMTFDSYCRDLARELGVEPSSRTRSLAESIKDGSFSASLRRAPPGSSG